MTLFSPRRLLLDSRGRYQYCLYFSDMNREAEGGKVTCLNAPWLSDVKPGLKLSYLCFNHYTLSPLVQGQAKVCSDISMTSYEGRNFLANHPTSPFSRRSALGFLWKE